MEELDEVYSKWNRLANMSASDLRAWSETECSRLASVDPAAVIARNLDLLETKKGDWTQKHIDNANRAISFIERMRNGEQGEPAREGCPSKRDISLKNWAHDPRKPLNKSADTMNDNELLVAYGGEVKALGDGRIGGYLVRFSGPTDPDLYGDFFTKSTDYGIQSTLPVFYQHGYDDTLKNRQIGVGEIRSEEGGLWFEAQLEKRDEYERMVMELVEMGKLGYSSGAVGHLVSRKAAENGAQEITAWHLGEASLVLNPAEPRNHVMSIKEYVEAIAPTKEIASDVVEPEADTAEAGHDHPAPTAAEAKSEAIDEPPVLGETPLTEHEDTTMSEQNNDVLKSIEAMIAAQNERLNAMEEAKAAPAIVEVPEEAKSAPAFIKSTGDSEAKAYAAWVREGDAGGLRGAKGYEVDGREVEIKASNDTDMNVGTAADGGNLVPTGHFEGIFAKKSEADLTDLLGLTRIPGVGTTVNVPFDNESDGEFISTNEAGSYDRDAPAIGQQAFTLVKYTKKVQLSEELLEDETSNLLAFIENFVGRGMAKTNNSLIVAEAAASGTEALATTAAGIAAGEIEQIAFNDTVQFYLDSPNIAWLTRGSTYGDIAALTGTDRLYAEQGIRSTFGQYANRPSLLGYPVMFSAKVDADGTGDNKPIFFGDWSQMGYYMGNSMKVLRDPYGDAASGQVNLFYSYRVDYEILQSEAIVYGRVSNT